MPRLLIIEDEEGIRESLADYFGGKDYLVSAVESVEAAEPLLVAEPFTIILLDLLLPGKSGLEFLQEFRGQGKQTPVIILTALGEESQRITGLKLGADDYVVKPFSVQELHARMDAIIRRVDQTTETVTIGGATIDLTAYLIKRHDREERLVKKEAELLGFLLRHPGQTFSRNDLLRRVWGYDATPTTRTVDTQIYNLRKKLEANPDQPTHLLTIHGVGYQLRL